VVLSEWIRQIGILPADLRAITEAISEDDLRKTYRQGGWNVRQIVHHIADSHLNSYIRFKWALTEENPVIKAYDEADWADLADSKSAPIDLSIDFLDSLHKRWVALLTRLTEQQWDRTFQHPETGRTLTLKWTLGLYAWHGNHHLAHIRHALRT